MSSGIIDQVLADGLLNTHACHGGPGTISNSVCLSNGSNLFTGAYDGNFSAGAPVTVTLRNDTLIGTGTAHGIYAFVGAGKPITFNFVNTIARGPGGAVQDIRADSTIAGTALNLSYSNYGTVLSTGTATTTPPGSGTNQTAAPLLDSSFRELPGSPTIDAGITDAANGPFDLDGSPRSQGGSTDIGAFETALPPSPAASPAAPSPLSFSLAARKLKVNRKGRGTLPFTCGSAAKGSCSVAGKLIVKLGGAKSARKRKRKSKVVGTVAGSVPAGRTGRLLVRLNGRGKKLVRRHKLRTRLTGSVSGGTGETAPLSSKLKVKLKLKRKRR